MYSSLPFHHMAKKMCTFIILFLKNPVVQACVFLMSPSILVEVEV